MSPEMMHPKNMTDRQSQAAFKTLGQLGEATIQGLHGEEASLLLVRRDFAETGVSDNTRAAGEAHWPKVTAGIVVLYQYENF